MKSLAQNLNLLITVLKNRNAREMNKECIGLALTAEFGPLTNKDLMLYARATRDNTEKYATPGCQIPPFYISRLIGPMFHRILSHKKLNMNIIRMVHAKQELTLHKKIHEGDTIKVKLFISAINDTDKGQECICTSHAEINGGLYQESHSTFLVIDPLKKKNRKKNLPQKELKENFNHSIETKEGQQLLYARVSRDTNFIHTSKFLAKLAGFPRTIMHGICIMAMACNTLIDQELDGNISAMKSMSVNFSKPVYPGDTIYATGTHNTKSKKISFTVKRKSGKTVLRNGTLTYTQ